MKNIYSGAKLVAQINKQHKAADSYRALEPWLLLHLTGRVDRFGTYSEARDEALKSYPGARIAAA